MKTVFFFAIFCLVASAEIPALQSPKAVKVTASGGSPIPTAFSSGSSQSRIIQNLSGYSHAVVVNSTSSDVAVNFGNDASAPGDDTGNVYIPPGAGVVLDNVRISGSVYLKSDSVSTITSGTVKVSLW